MWRRESALDVAAQAELEALEAALRGERGSEEHRELTELVATLQSLRPHPDEAFAATLDERAAQGFARTHAPGRHRPRPLAGAARRLRAHPALASALVVVLVAAGALPVALLSAGGGAKRAVPEVSSPGIASEHFPHELRIITPKSAAASATAAAAEARREVERSASLDVGVAPAAIQSSAQRVFTLASAYGGYVRQSNVSSGGASGGGASFEARVPSARLAGAIAALAHLGHVRSENETSNDVTERDASLSHSLGALRAERARVLAQLRRAEEPGEKAILRLRLRSFEGRIAGIQAAQRALRARVDFTNLALSLTPEAATGSSGGGALTPGGAARAAGDVLETAVAVLVLVAAALLPLAALALLVWLVSAATRRRLREQALDAS